MSELKLHAHFIAGEGYSTTPKYYLGHVTAMAGPANISGSITAAGASEQNNIDGWVDHSGGVGHSMSMTLPLGLIVDPHFDVTITSLPGENVVVFTSTCDAFACAAALIGQVITDNEGNQDTIKEPAQGFAADYLAFGMVAATPSVTTGPATITLTRTQPSCLFAWQDFIKSIIDVSPVGLLVLSYGVRDASTDLVAALATRTYRARITNATPASDYTESPYFCYSLTVEAALVS